MEKIVWRVAPVVGESSGSVAERFSCDGTGLIRQVE